MKVQVRILHRLPVDGRMAFDEPTPNSRYEEVYRYERSATKEDMAKAVPGVLEDIWRENNAVEGWEFPVVYERRSMMVGDIVEIAEPWLCRWWYVAPIGWQRRHAWKPVETQREEV